MVLYVDRNLNILARFIHWFANLSLGNLIHDFDHCVCPRIYRTSLVESKYVEVDELPLAFRRQKLVHGYIQRYRAISKTLLS